MQLHQLSATELRMALDRGECSSLEIVEALIARRQQVDPLVRAFVSPLDAEARDSAKRADRERKSGIAVGLLHGLPITIKENIDMQGMDSTMGLRHRQNKPAAADAVTVRVLRDQGAIPLGKTNVPQLLLAQESENVIWGITHNPWNLGRSPGGSSGGEAAAIASGQSPWGIGTDIGGSIRIPCHFCGIAGLKPTVDRWSNRGSATGVLGQELVRAQMGPMARRVEDLALLMRAVDPALSARRVRPRPQAADWYSYRSSPACPRACGVRLLVKVAVTSPLEATCHTADAPAVVKPSRASARRPSVSEGVAPQAWRALATGTP